MDSSKHNIVNMLQQVKSIQVGYSIDVACYAMVRFGMIAAVEQQITPGCSVLTVYLAGITAVRDEGRDQCF